MPETPSLTRQLAHNTLLQLIGRAIGVFLGIITVSLLTRYLGVGGFGQYVTIIGFLQVFATIADMGLSLVFVQMLSSGSKEEQAKIAGNILGFRLITIIFLIAIAIGSLFFIPYDHNIKLGIIIAALGFILAASNQVIIGVFQKNLAMYKVAAAEVLSKLIMLIFVIIVIAMKGTIIAVAWTTVIGAAVNFGIVYFGARNYIKIIPAWDSNFYRQIWKKTWPLALSIVFNMIYFRLDTVILSLYFNDATVGIYGAPYRILEILIQVPYIFLGLALPIFTGCYIEKNHEKLQNAVQKSFDFMAIIAIPLLIGGYFLSKKIMVLIAGQEFAISAPILRILLIAAAFIYFSSIFTHIIVAIDKQKKIIGGFLAVAILAVAGYLIFIPRFSYFGAAWMTVAAEGLLLVIAYFIVRKFTAIKISLITAGKSIIASLIMGLILYASDNLHLAINLLLGAAVYFLVMVMLKGVKKEMIKQIIKI